MLVRALEPFLDAGSTVEGVNFTDTGLLPPAVLNYIEFAVRARLFQGYPDGTFGPGKPLTRADLMSTSRPRPAKTPFVAQAIWAGRDAGGDDDDDDGDGDDDDENDGDED